MTKVNNFFFRFIQFADTQIKGKGVQNLIQFDRDFIKEYSSLEVKFSVGKGRATNIPWISFLGADQKTQDGIYPVFLYYKDFKIVILAYGVSAKHKPKLNWNLSSPETITGYFIRNGYNSPEKYGDSFVSKVYNVSLLDKYNIDADLNEVVNYYKRLISDVKNENKRINLASAFKDVIGISNLKFEQKILIREISSLLTKPFLILTGLSGSGKTKLAQAFAMWMSESKEQYAIVPVGADWTNREPLLGYPNSLKKRHYVKPDSGVLDILLNAHDNYTKNKEDLSLCKPYFLILDEMNLSHVERYFADFLSAMESGDEIKLYAGEDRSWEVDETINAEGDYLPSFQVPSKIKMPKNLFIIGTVNIDETTYMFSPKVLDRANTIEFRVTKDEMKHFFENHSPLDMNQLLENVKLNKGKGYPFSEDFMRLAKREGVSLERAKHKETFTSFFQQLQMAGTEFGYRTANEMSELIGFLNYFGFKDQEAYDVAIMQKLLPKLHGSRSKLSKVLPSLGALCMASLKKEDAEKIFDAFKSNQDVLLEKSSEIKFPLSFEKICRMNKNAHDNGFASYAEA